MPMSRKPLSSLEHLVMEVLWSRPSATTEAIRAALADRHPMKEPTVRTVLARLEEKGYARHTVAGRANIYQRTEGPGNVAARAIRQIIDRFCSGSVEQLLLGMVANDVIDEDELHRLAKRIKNGRAAGRRGNPPCRETT